MQIYCCFKACYLRRPSIITHQPKSLELREHAYVTQFIYQWGETSFTEIGIEMKGVRVNEDVT